MEFIPVSSYREYSVYQGQRKRCTDLGVPFGFTSIEHFFSEVGRRPSTQHSIEMIDPDEPFSPGNVRWITTAEKRAKASAPRASHREEIRKEKESRTLAKHAFYAAHRIEQAAYHAIRNRCKAEGIECRFESFEQFCAEIGPRPSPKHILKRIDDAGHYEPGNVRWTTRKQDTAEEAREKDRIGSRNYRAAHSAEIKTRRLTLYAAKHQARKLARQEERRQRDQARACKREENRQQREREDRARKAYKVYVLIDPITGKAKYVGHTSGTLWHRLKQHCEKTQARGRCKAKVEWVQSLKAQGFKPFILMLHSCATKAEALKWERAEIERLTAEGCDLLNGNLPLTPELAWKIYDLRMSGAFWSEIEKQTGVNYSTAWNVFQRMTGNVTPYMRESGYATYTEQRPDPSNTSNQILEALQ